MYTFIKLTVPPPGMIMFDGSNRDQCEVKRGQTNTPLQALIMMNDPTVLEASRVFAENLSLQKAAPDENIKKAFKQIICREPSAKEQKILSDYYNEQVQLFNAGKLDAALTLKVGEYPAKQGIDKKSTAALMKVISTIYNMEEAITKS
jgi:hypothetical protein